ncbi:hypothetical protein KQI52_05240 [bacterium]|nr:hypothetical protein [bacterium]
MGAFYLYTKKAPVLIERVRQLFAATGFGEAEHFELGPEARLMLYRKQVDGDKNHVQDKQGGVYTVGTLIYRGLTWRESLQRLLSDLHNDEFDATELRGAYCFIYHRGKEVRLHTDPMGLYHVFFDESRNAVSSSQLAILAGAPKRLSLNRMALLEKIATGRILGPETLAGEVFVYTPAIHLDLEGRWYKFKNLRSAYPPPGAMEGCGGNEEECADFQLEHLRTYFREIRPFVEKTGLEISLLGELVNRMVFMLTRELDGITPAIHSYWSSGDEQERVQIAKQIASTRGLDVRAIKLKQLNELDSETTLATLKDVVLFNDGVSNETLDCFSRIHTREFNEYLLGKNRLRIEGLNGEIYRNYYQINTQTTDFVYWMYYRLFYDGMTLAFNEASLLAELTDRMVAKTARLLRRTLPRRAERGVYRRHLGEVRSPIYSGPLINARLKLGHFLAPFAEYDTTLMAYRATSYIRSYGGFEALMRERLDPEVANLKSLQGYVPVHEPTSSRMRRLVGSMTPLRMMLAQKEAPVRREKVSWNHFNQVVGKHEHLRWLIDRLRDLYPSMNFDMGLWNPAMLSNAIFSMAVLDEFSDSFSF